MKTQGTKKVDIARKLGPFHFRAPTSDNQVKKLEDIT